MNRPPTGPSGNASPEAVSIDRDLVFPRGFLWGTATSAQQVEGGLSANDWYDYESSGRVARGEMAGCAIEHYSRFDEDFALLERLSTNAHRISIEWSRIEPEEGRFDQREIDHYKAVLEALARHGLIAFVTLHHFTSPRWFAKRGGFADEGNLGFFFRYCRRIAKELSGFDPTWNTINEPAVLVIGGHLMGELPPGDRDMPKAMLALRNIILAHGGCYRAIKEATGGRGLAGIVKNIPIFIPLDPESGADRDMAEIQDAVFNASVLRAIEEGRILIPGFFDEEAPGLRNTTDFYGLNYYLPLYASAARPDSLAFARPGARGGAKTTQMGWEIYPEGLGRAIRRLEEAGRPIYVTENGIATLDEAERIRYLSDHLAQVHAAIAEGADVRGYFCWSSHDNFEWSAGYRPRFGLIGVDRRTQRRTVKAGGEFYAEVAKTGCLTSDLVSTHIARVSTARI